LGVAGGRFVREKLACGAVPLCSGEETVGTGAGAVSVGADIWAEAIPLAGSFVGVAGTGGSIGAATGAGGLGDAATGGGVIFLGAGTGVGARSIIVGEGKGISGGGAVLSCTGGFAEAISVAAPFGGAGFFCNSIIWFITTPGPSPTSIRLNSFAWDVGPAHPSESTRRRPETDAAQATAHRDLTNFPFLLLPFPFFPKKKSRFPYSWFRPHSLILYSSAL